MENVSIFLAKFWGWYLVIFCMLLVVRPKRMTQLLSYLEDEKYLVLTSLLAIFIGLFTISLHNVWDHNWKLIITLLGWASLIKGIIRFSFPKTSLKAINSLNIKLIPYFLFILFVLGVFLLNEVYLLVPD